MRKLRGVADAGTTVEVDLPDAVAPVTAGFEASRQAPPPPDGWANDPRLRTTFTALAGAGLFYFVLQVFWPSPIGVIVQGMVVGGLTALISFGIALIYRANRAINFAQADLGSAPAALSVLLIVGPGLPYFVALPLGILAAVALGALVEFGIIRRFFKAPRLLFTVATIFLSQLLAPLSVILPRLFEITTPPQSFPSPFDFSFTINPIVFRGNDVIAMLVVPAVIVGLAAFFRYTNIGIAIRASAESTDRAFLVGIPVKRIQMIVWVIATVMATLAIFLRAGIVGLPIGRVLGPAILIRALAACVIGRMERLPTIFVAAMALGIVEQSIIWETGRAIIIAPILFVIILGALLVQRRGLVARADEGSAWQAAKDVRPVPQELAHVPEVKWGGKILTGLLFVFGLALPAIVPESRVNLVGVILIFAIVGVSLVVLTGWAGQISLGQVAFMGIGAAVGGAITERLQWDLSIALVLAGLAGAAAAMIIGLPALRIKGLFLAVITLAFAQAVASYGLNDEFFGWWLPSGRIARNPIFGLIAVDTEVRFYYLCLASFTVVLLLAKGLRHSHTGRAMIGIRENERAAQAFGVNATIAKLTGFAFSGFIAAFAGSLFVHHQQSLGITPFGPEQSLQAFTMVVIGGLGSIPGALIGSTYVRGSGYFLPPIFGFFTTGAGGLIMLMLLPAGVGGFLYQARDEVLRKVAIRRKILVPSLFADARDLSAITSSDEKGRQFLREMADQMDADRAASGASLGVGASGEPPSATALLELDDALPDEQELVSAASAPLPRRRRSTSRTGGNE